MAPPLMAADPPDPPDAESDQRWVWTGRSLLVVLVSAVLLVVAEMMILLGLVSLFVLAGGIVGANAGAALGGLVGLVVTLIGTLIGLVGWAVSALAAAAVTLVAVLAKDEGTPRHRLLATVGALLLIGGVLGTLATDGSGMLVGLSFLGDGDRSAMVLGTTFAVVAVGTVGLALIPHELEDATGRNGLYAFAGLGLGGAGAALAGGLTGIGPLMLAAAGLGTTAQIVYVWAVQRARKRVRHGLDDRESPTEPTSDAARPDAEPDDDASQPQAATDTESEETGMLVACSECGAHIPVDTEERPVVVKCQECGQRGVVKAPPTAEEARREGDTSEIELPTGSEEPAEAIEEPGPPPGADEEE